MCFIAPSRIRNVRIENEGAITMISACHFIETGISTTTGKKEGMLTSFFDGAEVFPGQCARLQGELWGGTGNGSKR